jgi:hypothetical protein
MRKIDVFPAIVRVAPSGFYENLTDITMYGEAPEGTKRVDRCRVVILNGKVLVARDSPTGTELIFREEVAETLHVDKLSYIKTISGKILLLTKDNNCGCGSRLRSWNPYGNSIGSSKDPSG